ncbi:MAG: glycosyltransferase family 4 protein [Candidatus Omnitrophota bacterium]
MENEPRAKSLLITFDYPPMVSGIGTFFANVWKHLPEESHVILAPRAVGFEEFDKVSNRRVIRYPNVFRFRLLRILGLTYYGLKLILKEKVDVVICGVPFTLGLVGLILKKITGKPYYVFYYGGEYEKFLNKRSLFFILEFILKQAEIIITNSEFTSSEVKKFNINPAKVIGITPGVDIELFKPGLDAQDIKKRFSLQNKKVLLTVSRLAKRKGIDTVIKALPEMIKNYPDIAYLIVGDGKEKEYLRKTAEEANVLQYVIFAGRVKDDELPLCYNVCDIYVMPNRQTDDWDVMEGFGISFIEASACGKAVIGGIAGGAADAVEQGKTGFLVDASNVNDVSQSILSLLGDAAKAEELGRNGRKRVEESFQWKDRAGLLISLLKKTNNNKKQ